jgi:hypothetical protein
MVKAKPVGKPLANPIRVGSVTTKERKIETNTSGTLFFSKKPLSTPFQNRYLNSTQISDQLLSLFSSE